MFKGFSALVFAASLQASPETAWQQAWLDVQTLAADDMAGRAPGTPGSQLAQAYIASRFLQLNLAPMTARFQQDFSQPILWSAPLQGTNLVGMRRGCVFPSKYMIITAHYDHLPVQGNKIFNGADDNASGVAGLLYLAAQSAVQCPAYTQVFVATDAEERGLFGAKWFWQQWPHKSQVVMNLNLDMISRGEHDATLYLAGSAQFPKLRQIAAKVSAEHSRIRLVLGRDRRVTRTMGADTIDWANASDHAIFRRAGIAYGYFGVDTHPQYHTPDDDWQRINPEFFQQVLLMIADTWRQLDALPPEEFKRR